MSVGKFARGVTSDVAETHTRAEELVKQSAGILPCKVLGDVHLRSHEASRTASQHVRAESRKEHSCQLSAAARPYENHGLRRQLSLFKPNQEVGAVDLLAVLKQ